MAWTETHIHAKCHLDPSNHLATIDMGRKLGALPPFWGGELGPHLTQSTGPRPTSIPSGIVIYAAIWPQQTWAENWGAPPPSWGAGAGSPSNTKSPTSIPGGILIHAAIWPQQTWAKNWGLHPFLGRGAGSPPNTMWPGLRPTCMPSFISIRPTIWL